MMPTARREVGWACERRAELRGTEREATEGWHDGMSMRIALSPRGRELVILLEFVRTVISVQLSPTIIHTTSTCNLSPGPVHSHEGRNTQSPSVSRPAGRDWTEDGARSQSRRPVLAQIALSLQSQSLPPALCVACVGPTPQLL